MKGKKHGGPGARKINCAKVQMVEDQTPAKGANSRRLFLGAGRHEPEDIDYFQGGTRCSKKEARPTDKTESRYAYSKKGESPIAPWEGKAEDGNYFPDVTTHRIKTGKRVNNMQPLLPKEKRHEKGFQRREESDRGKGERLSQKRANDCSLSRKKKRVNGGLHKRAKKKTRRGSRQMGGNYKEHRPTRVKAGGKGVVT